jgi:hypothetical protein
MFNFLSAGAGRGHMKVIDAETREPFDLSMTEELRADLARYWETQCKHEQTELRR